MLSPNLDRLHIVINKRDRELWERFAEEKFHGNLSQAIRDAMNESIARSSDEHGLLELRPVIERQDAIVNLLERALDTLEHVANQVEAMRSMSRVNTRVLLDAIFRVLEEAHHWLSTDEVCERLPGHTIQQVRRGLESLADRFVVEQIKREGRTYWKLSGVGDEE